VLDRTGRVFGQEREKGQINGTRPGLRKSKEKKDPVDTGQNTGRRGKKSGGVQKNTPGSRLFLDNGEGQRKPKKQTFISARLKGDGESGGGREQEKYDPVIVCRKSNTKP